MKRRLNLSIVTTLLIAAAPISLCTRRMPAAADNSRQNTAHSITADAQPNDRQDRMMAARLRRVIVSDDSLSIYGHNVKIIVSQGNITLEGPVRSIEERKEIAFDAATIVDPTHITDRVTVA